MKDKHFVIVGGGPSAQSAIDSLVQSGFAGKITLISMEKYPPYSRVALSKNIKVKGPMILLKDKNFY